MRLVRETRRACSSYQHHRLREGMGNSNNATSLARPSEETSEDCERKRGQSVWIMALHVKELDSGPEEDFIHSSDAYAATRDESGLGL